MKKKFWVAGAIGAAVILCGVIWSRHVSAEAGYITFQTTENTSTASEIQAQLEEAFTEYNTYKYGELDVTKQDELGQKLEIAYITEVSINFDITNKTGSFIADKDTEIEINDDLKKYICSYRVVESDPFHKDSVDASGRGKYIVVLEGYTLGDDVEEIKKLAYGTKVHFELLDSLNFTKKFNTNFDKDVELEDHSEQKTSSL